MANTFPNFPTSFGNIRVSVGYHTGPTLYVPMTEGTIPVTGGDILEAAEFGLKFLTGVIPLGTSDDGTYYVQAVPLVNSSNKVSTTTFALRWVTMATNAEAAGISLSAQRVRLFAIGGPN